MVQRWQCTTPTSCCCCCCLVWLYWPTRRPPLPSRRLLPSVLATPSPRCPLLLLRHAPGEEQSVIPSPPSEAVPATLAQPELSLGSGPPPSLSLLVL